MFELNNDLDIKIAKINEVTVVVVDNFYKNPDEVRELALSLGTTDNPNTTGGFPGIRAFYSTSEVREKLYDLYYDLCLDNNIWQRNRLLSIPQWKDEWDKVGFLCNIANDSTILKSPLGIIPHQDRYEGIPEGPTCQFGSVIYLNTPEECAGGTNIYSWNGNVTIPDSSVILQYYEENDGDFKTVKKSFDNSKKWKVEHEFEMVYNRMVLYEADILHGLNIDLGMFTDYDRINQILFM